MYATGKTNLDWKNFGAHFLARFGGLEQEFLHDNFKQLKQTASRNSSLVNLRGATEREVTPTYTG